MSTSPAPDPSACSGTACTIRAAISTPRSGRCHASCATSSAPSKFSFSLTDRFSRFPGATSLPVDATVPVTQNTPAYRSRRLELIRHIVFFSARRKEDVEAVRTGLLALAKIPHSSLFEVTLNTKVDPLSDALDVVVYAEFEDDGALP